jgi:hypothetical protein
MTIIDLKILDERIRSHLPLYATPGSARMETYERASPSF